METYDVIHAIEKLQDQVAELRQRGSNGPGPRMERLAARLDDLHAGLRQLLSSQRQQDNVGLEPIERAKQEWEATADAFSGVICLVDRGGRVIRANRAVEHWGLAQVVDVNGRALHELLHPGCEEPACYMRDFWDQTWRELSRGRPVECEVEDEVLQRHIHIRARWITTSSDGSDTQRLTSFAVVVVRDITAHRRTQAALERSRELAALSALTAAVSRSIELSEVLATLKRLLVTQLDIPGGAVFFYDEADDRLTLQTAWGLPAAMVDQFRAFPVSTFHNKCVIREREAVLRDDFREVPQLVDAGLDIARPGYQSYLCVPLLASEAILGVLGVFSRAPAVFGEAQMALFETLGRQAGVAIQNARLFEEVHTSRDRLRHLARQVVSAQEEERHRISHELHDEAGQALTALKVHLEMVRAALPAEVEWLRHQLSEAVSVTDTTMERIRLLARNIRPPGLDTTGLNLALKDFCRGFARRTHLSIDYVGADIPHMPEAVNISLYRFLQEALTNVAKHAHANQVWATLRYEGDILTLSVEDDGCGFDWQVESSASDLGEPTGIGLLGMQERLELVGGELEIWSRPGQGTRLVAQVPVKQVVSS